MEKLDIILKALDDKIAKNVVSIDAKTVNIIFLEIYETTEVTAIVTEYINLSDAFAVKTSLKINTVIEV